MTENYVGFIDSKVKEEYEKAKVEDPQLFKFLERATNDLKENPFCGIKIPQNLWPKEYIRKYSIDNLWKYDLPNAWRLIYTISKDRVQILAIILEWFDHKDYEKRFGYRKQ
jgi:Txe/YoeB family toxin of Txe-Axe toxin-antitoxin module